MTLPVPKRSVRQHFFPPIKSMIVLIVDPSSVFEKMTHFALVLKKKWTIYIQRFKYLLLHSNCTIPDSALCCEPANLSLKCLHFFHHKRQTGLYPHCFWEWFYKLSAGNKWEFTSFCLHWSIFFSLPSLNKTMQASWMMYCCT